VSPSTSQLRSNTQHSSLNQWERCSHTISTDRTNFVPEWARTILIECVALLGHDWG
jgi:hypothetical protein